MGGVRQLDITSLETICVGSVFRVSPNELSFASVASWKAIYGHQLPGKPTPV